jgi:hypothetical protein
VDGLNSNATLVVALRLADDGKCEPWLENAHEHQKPGDQAEHQSTKLHAKLARNDIIIPPPPPFARFFPTDQLAALYGTSQRLGHPCRSVPD